MAIVYILATFTCILGCATTTLFTAFSTARGMWFSALITALLTIIFSALLLDAVTTVDLTYTQTIAQMEGRANGE